MRNISEIIDRMAAINQEKKALAEEYDSLQRFLLSEYKTVRKHLHG